MFNFKKIIGLVCVLGISAAFSVSSFAATSFNKYFNSLNRSVASYQIEQFVKSTNGFDPFQSTKSNNTNSDNVRTWKRTKILN